MDECVHVLDQSSVPPGLTTRANAVPAMNGRANLITPARLIAPPSCALPRASTCITDSPMDRVR